MDCILLSYVVVLSPASRTLGSTEDWALTGLTVAILVPTLGMVGDQKKNDLARRVTWQRNVSECTHLRLEIKLKTQTGNSRLLLISESAFKVSGSFSSVFRLHPCAVCSATDIEESRNRQSRKTLSCETVIKEPPPAARIFNKPAMATMETMSMSRRPNVDYNSSQRCSGVGFLGEVNAFFCQLRKKKTFRRSFP